MQSAVRYPAFVAGWGTGKTAMGITKGMTLSENNPENLGVIFRKEYTDLRDSTLKDFGQYTGLKVNADREVILQNGSCIMFRHLEELHNLQNINLGWFLIEQAEEIESDDPFFKLWGRLRRNGYPHSGMVIANTNGHNWIYKLWKLRQLAGGELFEATTFDNAHNLDPAFVASMRQLEESKPAVFRRFVMNSWDEGDTTDVIIKPQDVSRAAQLDLNIQPPVKKVVSIDVARYGNDRTVFYALEMGQRSEVNTLGKETHSKKSTMETVGRALIFARKHEIDAFAVDEIGVGAGVVDRLLELGYQVIPVNAASRDTRNKKIYFNIRAEVYQNGADLFEAEKVQILPDDEELKEELSWARYKTIKSSGVYQVEAKEDIKSSKRLGKSPDCADAFLNGLYALPYVTMKDQKDKYTRAREKAESEADLNPMAV